MELSKDPTMNRLSSGREMTLERGVGERATLCMSWPSKSECTLRRPSFPTEATSSPSRTSLSDLTYSL